MANIHSSGMPRWVFFVRVAQAVLTILTLALTAFAAAVFGTFSGFALDWFVCFWTGAFLVFVLVLQRRMTQTWARGTAITLIPEIGTCFWWLVTFALLASESSALSALQNLYNAFNADNAVYGYKYTFGATGNAALACLKIAAAAGAFIFVSFVVTIIASIINIQRASRSGNPNFQHLSEPKPTTAFPQAEVYGNQSYGNQSYGNQVQPPQQAYGGQSHYPTHASELPSPA